MDQNCQMNLIRVACGKPIDKKFQHINEDLQRRGYLVENKDGCELFSLPFREFVLEQGGKGKHKKSLFGSLFGRRGD